jgi:hypothetical protein
MIYILISEITSRRKQVAERDDDAAEKRQCADMAELVWPEFKAWIAPNAILDRDGGATLPRTAA